VIKEREERRIEREWMLLQIVAFWFSVVVLFSSTQYNTKT
jgi:hypothetical protein